METKLERISQLSRENLDMVFTSIGHLIDKELLRQCHTDMDGKKAVGMQRENQLPKGELRFLPVKEIIRKLIKYLLVITITTGLLITDQALTDLDSK